MQFIKITLITTLILGSLPAHSNAMESFSARDIYTTLTATRTRKIACCLAAALLAHKAYKIWCHKVIKEQAQLIKEDPRVRSNSPARWIFVHGVGDNAKNAEKYKDRPENPRGFMPADAFPLEFDDAVDNLRTTYERSQKIPWKDLFTLRESALAQAKEIIRLKEMVEQYPQENLILFGVSRGAATIINYVATHKPGNVKAIILESPFDDIQSVVGNLLSKCYLHLIPGLTDVGNLICAALFKNYSTCAVAPIDVVDQLPKHIPVLFVCSFKDKLIPAASTRNLHQALIESGHKKAYLLQTNEGAHAEIINGSEADLYKRKVNNFLRMI